MVNQSIKISHSVLSVSQSVSLSVCLSVHQSCHVMPCHAISCHSISSLSTLFYWEKKFHHITNWLLQFRFCLFQNLYKQQQKLFQQQRIVQSQRLKRVRQLHEDYTKNLQEMQRGHEAQQISVQEQLRKEVNMLQKKILSDTVG